MRPPPTIRATAQAFSARSRSGLFPEAYHLGLLVRPGVPFGVGAFFLPREPEALRSAVALIERILADNRLPSLGWREVPVEPSALGPRRETPVRSSVRRSSGAPDQMDDEAWERVLYLARRDIEREAAALGLAELYVCSLSCRTVVYKALLAGTQLAAFYTDFRYPEFETASRCSTSAIRPIPCPAGP